MDEHKQFDLKKILRFFTKEEVKTPLAFFFKVVPYLVAAWIAILYAPVSDEMKHSFFLVSSIILVGLCVLVGAIAWFRPKNLVYGESGHRAEHKLEFGTEERTIDETHLDLLEKVQNPKQLEEGNE
jgi:hypothetical protein